MVSPHLYLSTGYEPVAWLLHGVIQWFILDRRVGPSGMDPSAIHSYSADGSFIRQNLIDISRYWTVLVHIAVDVAAAAFTTAKQHSRQCWRRCEGPRLRYQN